MSESPNPSPTQEVETSWRVSEYAPKDTGRHGASVRIWKVELWGPQPSNHQRLMPVEDHQRLLRAEVEKREEAQRLAIQRKRIIEEVEDELEQRLELAKPHTCVPKDAAARVFWKTVQEEREAALRGAGKHAGDGSKPLGDGKSAAGEGLKPGELAPEGQACRQEDVLEVVEGVGAALASGNEHVDYEPGPYPYRAEFHYTLVADDVEAAGDLWEQVDGLAQMLGFNGEGGAVSRMDADELICSLRSITTATSPRPLLPRRSSLSIAPFIQQPIR